MIALHQETMIIIIMLLHVQLFLNVILMLLMILMPLHLQDQEIMTEDIFQMVEIMLQIREIIVKESLRLMLMIIMANLHQLDQIMDQNLDLTVDLLVREFQVSIIGQMIKDQEQEAMFVMILIELLLHMQDMISHHHAVKQLITEDQEMLMPQPQDIQKMTILEEEMSMHLQHHQAEDLLQEVRGMNLIRQEDH
jgi:heme/copper-type cytochrome/quinol oxidase subunit 2